MKYFWLTATILFFSFFGSAAQAGRYPMLADISIASCDDNCTKNVLFSTTGAIQWVSAPDTQRSDSFSTYLVAFGTACPYSKEIDGIISGCEWNQSTFQTSPVRGKCETVSPTSWVLTDDSTCTIQAGTFGPYRNLKAQTKCIIIGKFTTRYDQVDTPWGLVSADDAVNGNGLCLKASPPDVKCTLKAVGSAIIDHGTVPSTGESTRTLQFQQDCGKSTLVTVMNNGKLDLADGVSTTLSILNKTAKGFTLESRLSTVNASAGAYQASTVVMVSPQ